MSSNVDDISDQENKRPKSPHHNNNNTHIANTTKLHIKTPLITQQMELQRATLAPGCDSIDSSSEKNEKQPQKTQNRPQITQKRPHTPINLLQELTENNRAQIALNCPQHTENNQKRHKFHDNTQQSNEYWDEVNKGELFDTNVIDVMMCNNNKSDNRKGYLILNANGSQSFHSTIDELEDTNSNNNNITTTPHIKPFTTLTPFCSIYDINSDESSHSKTPTPPQCDHKKRPPTVIDDTYAYDNISSTTKKQRHVTYNTETKTTSQTPLLNEISHTSQQISPQPIQYVAHLAPQMCHQIAPQQPTQKIQYETQAHNQHLQQTQQPLHIYYTDERYNTKCICSTCGHFVERLRQPIPTTDIRMCHKCAKFTETDKKHELM
jgi:hypothetical protein